MKLRVNRMYLMTIAFLVLLFCNATATAKNTHCVVAVQRIFDSYIAATKASFLHLDTLINTDPGVLLYVLPKAEAANDKPKGSFYYVESITSDCDSLTMTLSADNDNEAILIASVPPTPKHLKLDSPNGPFDAIIEWRYPNGITTQETVHFKPTSSARLQGFVTGIPNKDVERIIAKTTYAVCSRENEGVHDDSETFRQCLAISSGQMYIDQLKK